MATENTHMAVLAGAGGTAAGDTTLGTITLPAGGPWIIHNVFGLIARATATAGELVGGSFRMFSRSGDISPQPQPSSFPLNESGSFLGAIADSPCCPLHLFDVNYEAQGKAAIDLIYNQATAVTVAPQLILGVAFGKERPVASPIINVDVVRAQVNAAALTAVGNIVLSEKASKITGIFCSAIQDNVITAGEELIGFVQLSSNDIDLTPMQVPLANAFGAGLGATIQSAMPMNHAFIPVSIPVLGGSTISAAVDLNTALTNAAEVSVYIAYE